MKYNYLFWIIAIALSFSSCEKLEIPSNNTEETDGTNNVIIMTRSSTNDIKYPVKVYAFSDNGECAAQQTINSDSEKLSLSLKKGNYKIIALSGAEAGELGYSVPATPSLSSIISMNSTSNYSTSPLQTGEANVTVGGTNQTVNIVLSYKVATVNLTLSDVPSSVTSVSVNIAQQYSSMTIGGEYKNAKSTTIELKKNGALWSTGDIYVFAGASSTTIFTLSLTDTSCSTSYGYTYSSPLNAATPYKINGAYSTDMISLSGMLLSDGWSDPVDLSFNFGPGNTDNGDSSGDEPQKVSSYPSAGTIWNGHLVAYVYSDDGTGTLLSDTEAGEKGSVNLLLLSLNEWSGVSSSVEKSKDPTEASSIASQYTEGDVTGWSIPSKSEATYLKALYFYNDTNTLENLNSVITSNGGTSITAQDDKGENKRFLCEDATYTFAWKSGSSFSKAGYSVTYSLRLVKTVRLSK